MKELEKKSEELQGWVLAGRPELQLPEERRGHCEHRLGVEHRGGGAHEQVLRPERHLRQAHHVRRPVPGRHWRLGGVPAVSGYK